MNYDVLGALRDVAGRRFIAAGARLSRVGARLLRHPPVTPRRVLRDPATGRLRLVTVIDQAATAAANVHDIRRDAL